MTDATSHVVDPRREANERVGGRFDARVLEPSPPPVASPPWFADDPVNDAAESGLPVLAPVPVPDVALTWEDIVRDEPELAPWCADRWLATVRPLLLPPDIEALAATRNAWHALAEHVLAPARHRANGKIGLRYTRGGFGTPFFGDLEQLRLTDEGLTVLRGGEQSLHLVNTVHDAARVVGIEPGAPKDVYSPTTALEPEARLEVDAASARFLGDWFGFGALVLEGLRANVPATDDPARVQLWPEHFDLSVDFGDDAAGRRATYGASPGDADHPAPYLYVTPWTPQTGDFWNERTFASLDFDALAGQSDQRRVAFDFFDRARDQLEN
jgi:hypothetical protein